MNRPAALLAALALCLTLAACQTDATDQQQEPGEGVIEEDALDES